MEHDTIFVSIASYRDLECPKTIADCFRKAMNPSRIFIGVCQQNNPEDVDCMACLKEPGMRPEYEQQIRVYRLAAGDAQGPMLARHIIGRELYRGETYFLQLDAHTLFVPQWDLLCILQLAMCPSEKPVLTCYPSDFDRKTRRIPSSKTTLPSFLKYRGFHPRLGFTQQDRVFFKRPPTRLYPSLFWAAGFSFTLGSFVQEVPYDPYCPYIFVGEEMSMMIRAYTRGWDFFSPMINIVYQVTDRTYRPTFWEQVYRKRCVVSEETRQERKEMEYEAGERLRALIRGDWIDGGPEYNLGTVRTLKDWEDYAGVSIFSKKGKRRSYYGLSAHSSEQEQLEKLNRVYFPRNKVSR